MLSPLLPPISLSSPSFLSPFLLPYLLLNRKGINHRIRNKLEGLKAARRKEEIEGNMFTTLMEQMANSMFPPFFLHFHSFDFSS
jgi:hypothetical protein